MKCNELISNLHSTFQDPQRCFTMKSVIPVHTHIHTLQQILIAYKRDILNCPSEAKIIP